MKVLIVEDEMITALGLEKAVGKMGFTVIGHAVSSDEALIFVQDSHPDLIFMDIKIAGAKDGIDAAEAVREIENIPIIFLTAYCDASVEKRIEKLNFCEVVNKPYDFETLRDTVHGLLRSTSSG